MARLRKVTYDGAYDPGPPLEIPPGRDVTIGRALDNTIVLKEPGVSRKHARISETPHGHVIADLGSDNGVLVGGMKVRERVLQDGDLIQVGFSRWQYDASEHVRETQYIPAMQMVPLAPDQMAAARRQEARGGGSNKAPWIVMFAIILAGGAAGAWFLVKRGGEPKTTGPTTMPGPTPGGSPGGGVTSGGGMPGGVTSAGFTTTATGLTARIAALNVAQEAVLSGQVELGKGLADVSAAAFAVATQAEELARAQAGQEDGGKLAAHYASVAKIAYAVALEASQARTRLSSGAMTADGARQLMRVHGTRLSTPTDGKLPFGTTRPVSQVAPAAAGAGAPIVQWMAVSGQTSKMYLDVDPARLTSQADKAAYNRLAVAVAAAPGGFGGGASATDDEIARLLAKSGGVDVPDGVVVQSGGDGNLVTFANGSAAAVRGDGDTATTTLYDTDAGGKPTALFSSTVQAKGPAATLTVNGVNRPPNKNTAVYVAASFTATVDGPFEITCYSPSWSEVTTVPAAGKGGAVSLVLNLKTTNIPSDALPLYCTISRDGVALATIDSAIPPTSVPLADAGPVATAPIDAGVAVVTTTPPDAAPALPPKTPAKPGDLAWIDPYVDKIASDLIKADVPAGAIVQIVETLRSCLYTNAATMGEKEAKKACAKVIKDLGDGKPPPPDKPPPPPPTASAFQVEGTFNEAVKMDDIAVPSGARFYLNFDPGNRSVRGWVKGSGKSKSETYLTCSGGEAGPEDQKAIYEVSYRYDVEGSYDPATGKFSATGRLDGDASAEISERFKTCPKMDTKPPETGRLNGDGEISGSVGTGNAVTFKTKWKSGGYWRGSGSGKGEP